MLALISVVLAFRNDAVGDYHRDGAPAVGALIHGHVGAYLTAKPIMGPFATLFQAPFALIGGSGLAMYQWACLPCLLAVAALGWYLARVAARRGAGELAQWLIAVLCVLNPLTLEALRLGHPEELLTAALAVGAVVVASEGHSARAAVLLGLAIASKQWAVLAVFPVLMALPSRRLWTAGVAAAIVAVLMAPGLIASPSSFMNVQGNAASGGGIAWWWSVWYPVSPPTVFHLGHGPITMHGVPSALRPLTHPLIVGLMLLVPLGLWARRRRFGLDASRALALLTLLALLRCALDPVDNIYYHAPLLIALFAWDAVAPRGRLPLRGLVGAALAFFFWRWSTELYEVDTFNLVYLAVVAIGGIAIANSLLRGDSAPEPEAVNGTVQAGGRAIA